MIASVALRAAFFLSGAAGLIFQIVWFYRCGLVLGTSVGAVTVVLSGFMAGLAAGNAAAVVIGRRTSRPLAVYAALEATVAVTGLAVTFVLPHLASVLMPLVRVAGESPLVLNGTRFLLAFVLLVLPATAMGATLPILVTAMCRMGESFGSGLGRLYGWNTLGAVGGVLVAETVLIARFGVPNSAWIAAALNLCAAGVALALRSASEGGTVPAARIAPASSGAAKERAARVAHADPSAGAVRARFFVAAATCGALLLALEVVWFRLLTMYVLVTTLAVSLMLAVVLAGIGAGGLLAATWLRRERSAASWLPAVACGAALVTVGAYALFQGLTSGTQIGDWHTVLWFASLLTLPTAIASGLLFTLIGEAIHDGRDATASTGWLTLANTAGAMCGPPVAAYVLVPVAGLSRTIVMLATGYVAVMLLTWSAKAAVAGRTRRWNAPRAAVLTAVAAGIALFVFPFEAMSSRYVVRAAAAYADDGSRVVALREGPAETLFVMQQHWLGQQVYSRLITNGFSMSGTALQGQRYMRAFAYYPMLFHDGPLKRALVVCYGVGVTVGAVTHIPDIERIDVAEISRDVVAMSDVIYPDGARPLEDPRVRLHIEDGRFFLETTADRFDLITGEPPPPRTPGTVNIYTREYFQLVHDRLAEGGIATYWVPVARPQPGTDVNTIIRAFCDVFSDCSLWNATPFDLMLVGSRDGVGQRTLDQFSRPWQTPGLESRLREVGFERAEQIGATFVGDATFLRELTRDTPALTDDYPQRLRPVAGRPSLSDPGYGRDPDVTRLYQSTIDVHRARSAFEASPYIRSLWPPELIERTRPYFDVQALLNRVYWEGARPVARIADLDRVLSATTLRTLPLWMLGSDEVKERIAETADDGSGATEYARALRAISGRDFAGAAQWLEAAERRGVSSPAIGPLRAYVLSRAGRIDEARALMTGARPTTAEERQFWDWLHARLAPT
jgi:spermidine synthase